MALEQKGFDLVAAFRTSLPLIFERRDDIEPELAVAHEHDFIGGVAIL